MTHLPPREREASKYARPLRRTALASIWKARFNRRSDPPEQAPVREERGGEPVAGGTPPGARRGGVGTGPDPDRAGGVGPDDRESGDEAGAGAGGRAGQGDGRGVARVRGRVPGVRGG